MRWFALLISLAICFSVAATGGQWTAGEINGWYRTLARPGFAPPNWVFGPVWTLLYGLMALAAWLVWQTPQSPARSWALGLFAVQLALNLTWTWIFFRQHAIGAALTEIIVLWLAIAATAVAFSRVELRAAWLMAPYLAWVTFASALNAGFWRLN